jgi:hypothetical protein
MHASDRQFDPHRPNTRTRAVVRGGFLRLACMGAVVLGGVTMVSGAAFGKSEMACTKTALNARKADDNEARDDRWIATGICQNLADTTERKTCIKEARADEADARSDARIRFRERKEICALVGEEPYDPDFSPENFVDPLKIGDGVAANPYFPLIIGAQWIYESGNETITVTVTDKVKLIDDVTCVVATDVVEEDDQPIEVTDDWFAQDLDGNVWYCGEIARNFEVFEDDDPPEAELVDIDGSWKAGREDAKPGIIMLAAPQVGDVYREEFALGEAEDLAEVVDVAGDESAPAADCNGGCVVTRNFSPFEPGINEFKSYAPGVGLVVEIDADGGRVELVEFSIP